MKRAIISAGLGLFVLLLGLEAPGAYGQQAPGRKPVRLLMQTDLGEIELRVEPARAPDTADNFLKYVEGGRYDGGRFHRSVTRTPDNQPNNTIKIEVIQGGVAPEKAAESFAPIKLERTNATGLKHENGTLSMARSGPDTATSDFFICIGDQPELDFGGRRNPDGQGFAAFGRVVRGMEIVRKIHQSPVEEQRLTPAVRIVRIKRIR